jgi:hypothetical protein
MTKGVIDAEAILNRARPLAHQEAPEIQPYGHLVKLPIAPRGSARPDFPAAPRPRDCSEGSSDYGAACRRGRR